MRVETILNDDNKMMHFLPEDGVAVTEAVEFSDPKSIRKSPLAESIFDIGGIVSVLITPESVSVEKEENEIWADLKPQILAEIVDYLSRGEDIITNYEKDNIEEIIRNIKGLIDARIRPAVQKDGGDIAFRSFENGIVYVEMLGKCVGCPYSQITLKERIDKILTTYIKEVIAVEKYER